MDIFTGLASLFGGGLTGIVGSVAQRVFEYKSKKLDIELQKEKFVNEIALRKVDAEIMAQEWASRTKVAEIEGNTQIETEETKAFNTALSSEPKLYHEGVLTSNQNWLMVLLDFLRGSIRPLLTLYLCGITTIMYFQAKHIMGTSMLPMQAYDLVNQIITTILYLTTTCVLFWFGSRNPKKK